MVIKENGEKTIVSAELMAKIQKSILMENELI